MDRVEIDEFADVGPLPLPRPSSGGWPLSPRPFVDTTRGGGAGRPFGMGADSCGAFWLPMGVARRSWGRAGREGCTGCGASVAGTALLLTGLLLGEGGMPRVSFGARGLPLLLRLPGTGGRRSGTEDDMARLFCLSLGKNNSFGSASVATVSMDGSTR